MAIAFDNSISIAPASPVSGSFTVGATSTLVIAVVVNGAVGWSPSSITLGGEAMTYLTDFTLSGGSLNNWHFYVYYKFSPLTGSQTISCTGSGSAGGIYLVATSYTGTKTSVDASHTDTTSSGSTLTNTVTTIASSTWCFGVATCNDNGGSKPSANTGCTRRVLSSDDVVGLFDSNGTLSAGSNSFVYNINGTHGGKGFIFSVEELASSIFTKNNFSRQAVKRSRFY